jgi:hypothetical protein
MAFLLRVRTAPLRLRHTPLRSYYQLCSRHSSVVTPPLLRLTSPVHQVGQSRALSSAAKDEPNDAYAVLGLQRGVDEATLRAVYKELAKEWHPDRHEGPGRPAAEARFQAISEAFQLLNDTHTRAEYDKELDAARTAAQKVALKKKYKAQTWNTEIPDMQVTKAIHATRDVLATISCVAAGLASPA